MPAPTPPRRRKQKLGKSADKKNWQQYSVYVKRKTRRMVGRKLEDQRDDDPEFDLDFSELVQGLLELYLADRFRKRQLLDAAGGSTR